MLTLTREITEDSYTNRIFEIMESGATVGGCSVMVDDRFSYCERIDIDEAYRNRGFGTAALRELSELYGGIVVAPDNADAQRLYERIGSAWTDDLADYIDQGYGVYCI